jgi:uncharacterized protein YecE (DUF72 family)
MRPLNTASIAQFESVDGFFTPSRVNNPGYVRFHGTLPRYAGGYSEKSLRSWAQWLSEQAGAGRTAFAYFNNDAGAQAVVDAQTLRAALARML